MTDHNELLDDPLLALENVRADLAAAEGILPPLNEIEAATREALEAATDEWRRFVGRLAAQIASCDTISVHDATGRAGASAGLALGAAIDVFGIDALVKRSIKAAEKLNPNAVRVDATTKAEMVAELRRDRYVRESALADAHFDTGGELPDDCHPGALLGVPCDVIEAAGLLTWND